MDFHAEKVIAEEFMKFLMNGALFQGSMPVMWSPVEKTALADAEVEYEDHVSPTVHIGFPVTTPGPKSRLEAGDLIVIWTTTPWTLPENLALCVGTKIEYAIVEDLESGDHLIFALERLGAYDKKLVDAMAKVGDGSGADLAGCAGDKYRFVRSVAANDLVGLHYEPLFPYFADQPNSFVVLQDGFVTTEDGTGIVHIAPAYGEDDFRIGRAANIDLVDPLDEEARFKEPVTEYKGQGGKDADKAIPKRFEDQGNLGHQTQNLHTYPVVDAQ